MIATFRDIQDGVRGDPGRFLFSIASITVGLLTLVILIGASRGLEIRATEMIRGLGLNVFGILTQSPRAGEPHRPLRTVERDRLKLSLGAAQVAGYRLHLVPTLGTDTRINVVAADPELIDVRGWQIASGRGLEQSDLDGTGRVALVSRSLSRRWGWGVDAVIQLGQSTFRVVGVVDTGPGGAASGEVSGPHLFGEEVIFVPMTPSPYWAGTASRETGLLDGIYVRSSDPERYAENLMLARRLLDVPNPSARDTVWITPDRLVANTRTLRDTLGYTLGFIVVLSMGLGLTTLVGMMIANVRERTHEIGLRRALGAGDWQIRLLFILEALLVTVSAYLLAFGIAWMLSLALGHHLPLPLLLDWTSFLAPLAIAVFFGTCASLIPAEIARRIQPALALRY